MVLDINYNSAIHTTTGRVVVVVMVKAVIPALESKQETEIREIAYQLQAEL
jgi:hypothetical protein